MRFRLSRATPTGGTPATRSDLLGQVPVPLRRFIGNEAGSAGFLLVAALVALVWANSAWSQSYVDLWHTEVNVSIGEFALSMSLHEWVNDGLMALFFFVIGLEVRRELSVGELVDRRAAVIPLVSGLAGMVVPAVIFLAMNPSEPQASGWGIVIGTDTAFMLGALAIVGPRFSTQLRIFLLTLTVIDDFVAVAVIGLVYSGAIAFAPLVAAVAGLVGIAMLSRSGVWRAAPYVLVLAAIWLATLQSGLHPSIAGMAAGLLVAAHSPERQDVEAVTRLVRAFRQSPMPELSGHARRGLARSISVNERMQHGLHPWSSYVVVPLFALANAGVDLRDGVLGDALGSTITWGVMLGLVVGKFLGIGVSALLGSGSGSDGCRPVSGAVTSWVVPPCRESASRSRCSSRASPSNRTADCTTTPWWASCWRRCSRPSRDG